MTDPVETPRALIATLLRRGPATLRDLSVLARLPEAAVAVHLEHISKSVRARGERFVVEPPRCHECGFTFEGRERARRPSRCPECRSGRVSLASFRIEGTGS